MPTTELRMVAKSVGSSLSCLYAFATEDFGLQTTVYGVIHTVMGEEERW